MQRDFYYAIDDQPVRVRVEQASEGYRVTVGGQTYSVIARHGERGRLELVIDGRRVRAHVALDGQVSHVSVEGASWSLAKADRRRQRQERSGDAHNTLSAAMPGLILDVLVAAGDMVARGETLVLMEAMKMEIRLTAPQAGMVRQVHCQAGQIVQRGHLLLEMEKKQNG